MCTWKIYKIINYEQFTMIAFPFIAIKPNILVGEFCNTSLYICRPHEFHIFRYLNYKYMLLYYVVNFIASIAVHQFLLEPWPHVHKYFLLAW